MKLRWGRLEWFVLILFLLNGLLLLPGMQSFRFVIRSAPYMASMAAFLWRKRGQKLPPVPGAIAMQLVLIVLALSLLHPRTQAVAGLAQVLFQFAIVCPAFWAGELAEGDQRLVQLLRLVFVCNAIGSAVGILQIYYPDQFLPSSLSAAAGVDWVSSMTFVAPSGRVLMRPPGLSDLPGGAANAGSIAAVLGLAFGSLRSTGLWTRAVCLGSAAMGIAVLYLAQVRSLALMTLLGMLVLAMLAMRNRRIWSRSWIAGAGALLVAGSFFWAVSVGGEHVRDRFLNLSDQGVMSTYESSRGFFWKYTFGDVLTEHPFGAGLGRWGMMESYFADRTRSDAPTLWAEIQLTGWLYDGGIAMWAAYGTGLLLSMFFILRMAMSKAYGQALPFAAALIFCINLNVIGASFTGPSFNTTMGMQYWMLTAVLYGAARKTRFGVAA